MDSGSDTVIAKVKVFVAKPEVDKQLFVLQNITQSGLTIEEEILASCRIKPRQQKLEMKLKLDTDSRSMDIDSAKSIAEAVDGQNQKESERFFKGNIMDELIISTGRSVTDTKRYAVGYLHDGELHLKEVTGVLQVKSNFNYLEIEDKIKIAYAEEEDEKVEVILPKFESEKSIKAKMNSFNYLQQQLNEEPWVNLSYHGTENRCSRDEREKLLSLAREHKGHQSGASDKTEDYLKAMIGQVSPQTKALKKDANTPIYQLQHMNFQDQVNTLMIKVKLLSFSRILQLLPNPPVHETALVSSLQQAATLIHGCWVVSSELLYPTGHTSPTGVSSEQMCRARDYVLWKFMQKRSHVRRDFKTGLPDSELLTILQQVAFVNAKREWEFLLPTDDDFLQRFPQTAAEETKRWAGKFNRAEDVRSGGNEGSPTKVRHRRRTKSQQESDEEREVKTQMGTGGGEEVLSEATAATLTTFLNEQLDRNKVCTVTMLRQAMVGIATLIGISDKTLVQTLLNLGASKLDVQWPPESKPEPLLCRLNLGDSMDCLRKELFNVFRTGSYKHRRSYIKKKLDTVNQNPISDYDLAVLLKDYCVIGKSGMCYVKGTLAKDR